MEIYEVLFMDVVSNCDTGDLISFPWIDEDGEPFTDQVRIVSIDVGATTVLRGISDVTNETTTYELDSDTNVNVLGG